MKMKPRKMKAFLRKLKRPTQAQKHIPRKREGAHLKSKTRGGFLNPPPVFLDPFHNWEVGWFSVLSIVCFVAP